MPHGQVMSRLVTRLALGAALIAASAGCSRFGKSESDAQTQQAPATISAAASSNAAARNSIRFSNAETAATPVAAQRVTSSPQPSAEPAADAEAKKPETGSGAGGGAVFVIPPGGLNVPAATGEEEQTQAAAQPQPSGDTRAARPLPAGGVPAGPIQDDAPLAVAAVARPGSPAVTAAPQSPQSVVMDAPVNEEDLVAVPVATTRPAAALAQPSTAPIEDLLAVDGDEAMVSAAMPEEEVARAAVEEEVEALASSVVPVSDAEAAMPVDDSSEIAAPNTGATVSAEHAIMPAADSDVETTIESLPDARDARPSIPGAWRAAGTLPLADLAGPPLLLTDGRALYIDQVGVIQMLDVRSGAWTAAARGGETGEVAGATLLRDGRVLVLNSFQGEARLYDPGADRWSDAGFVSPGPGASTAVLADGRVLLAGGVPSARALIYNPETGELRQAPPMHRARLAPVLTVLPDGRVLAAGGVMGGATRNAEIYDPATDSWTLTGATVADRQGARAVLLNNGMVLLTGGLPLGQPDQARSLASAELYNPATGLWRATGSMQTARYRFTMTLLPSGEVLVTGGNPAWGEDAIAETELYNPATGLWRSAGAMTTGRAGHGALLLPNGSVLISGGDGGWNERGGHRGSEVYEP